MELGNGNVTRVTHNLDDLPEARIEIFMTFHDPGRGKCANWLLAISSDSAMSRSILLKLGALPDAAG
ncbi:MAG: hypothetical protein ACLPVW_07840 [Terriglobales bacterium]